MSRTAGNDERKTVERKLKGKMKKRTHIYPESGKLVDVVTRMFYGSVGVQRTGHNEVSTYFFIFLAVSDSRMDIFSREQLV